MKNNRGATILPLVITIIILLVLAGIALYFTIGENGVVKKVEDEEITFNKDEVLEGLNIIIREKYLDAYSKGTKDGKNNLDQFYNGEKVIQFLLGYSGGEDGNVDMNSQPDSTKYIEVLSDSSFNKENFSKEENVSYYFINLEELKRDINRYGKGENGSSGDFFYLKCSGDSYKVYYLNLNGEEEEIGDLQIKQEL